MDKQAMRAFMGRFMEMTTGAAVMGVMAVADRVGLFPALAGQGALSLDEIVERTGTSQSNISQHLEQLRNKNIVTSETMIGAVEYLCRLCSLSISHLDIIDPGLGASLRL